MVGERADFQRLGERERPFRVLIAGDQTDVLTGRNSQNTAAPIHQKVERRLKPQVVFSHAYGNAE